MSVIEPVSVEQEDFSVNLDPKATANRFVIPDGDYGARLANLVRGKSKAGKDMYTFTFIGTEGASEGNEYRAFATLNPEAQWKLVEILAAFGVKPTADNSLPIKRSELIGKRVTLELVATTFGDDKTSMSVEKVKAPKAGAATSSTNDIPF